MLRCSHRINVLPTDRREEELKQPKPRMLHKLNASWPITSSLRGYFRQRRNTSGTCKRGLLDVTVLNHEFLSLLYLPRLGYLLGVPCAIEKSFSFVYGWLNGGYICFLSNLQVKT